MKQISNQKRKTYIIVIITVLAITIAILTIPDMVIKSMPTAQNVTVKKLTHNDTIDVSGSIIKDAQTGQMWVQTFVNEKDISNVKIGQIAEITGDAFPNCIYTGEVKTIADMATKIQVGNAMKTMVQVDIEIVDADDTLKAGFTANAKVKTSEEKEMTIIPYDVINQDKIGEYVYVLRDGKAIKKYISTGEELSQGVEVLNGILDGDTIISVDKDIEDGKAVILEE